MPRYKGRVEPQPATFPLTRSRADLHKSWQCILPKTKAFSFLDALMFTILDVATNVSLYHGVVRQTQATQPNKTPAQVATAT
eukprot:773250-Pleurochrysis_carterae.AAC.1